MNLEIMLSQRCTVGESEVLTLGIVLFTDIVLPLIMLKQIISIPINFILNHARLWIPLLFPELLANVTLIMLLFVVGIESVTIVELFIYTICACWMRSLLMSF
tara:strand:+ start:653 stop:961 length:309 start_codon:yes stop_codon:yes gene_type:complete